MPRMKSSAGSASSFRQVQQQARALLNKLRREIRAKEAELSRLKREEETLARITGRRAARGARVARAGGRGGGRINWRNVLSQLSRQFKASNIRQVRGLKDKRPSEIFAAITRWIDAGLVKRKSRGVYEKA